jgi:hypothetical protein
MKNDSLLGVYDELRNEVQQIRGWIDGREIQNRLDQERFRMRFEDIYSHLNRASHSAIKSVFEKTEELSSSSALKSENKQLRKNIDRLSKELSWKVVRRAALAICNTEPIEIRCGSCIRGENLGSCSTLKENNGKVQRVRNYNIRDC